MRRVAAALAAAAAAGACAPAAGAGLPAIPIPGPLDGPLPRFTGAPAQPQPLTDADAPGNPVLAANGRSGSGLAPGNGGASPYPGPLGNGTASASALQFGTCASLAFDAADRLLAVCSGPLGPQLRLIDPSSLATLAALVLPPRTSADRADLAGGTHFVVRADGTLLVPTNGRRLLTVAVEGSRLRQAGAADLTPHLAAGERPFAVAAGFDGFEWVAGNLGTAVTLPRDGGAPQALALGEAVSEDLATGPAGTFLATNAALYRLRAGAGGVPEAVWRRPLTAPGTPPVLLDGGRVAIADGADPPALHVFDAATGDPVCTKPLFPAGAGKVDAHLLAAGASVAAFNSHGYTSPLVTEGGRTTTGGAVRIDVGPDGCEQAWSSPVISPTAQPVLSRATGLLYTLEKPPGFPDAWNLAALDWRTGEHRWSALAGEGLGHNSEGGALALGPDGAAFAGTFGGVVRFADGG